ncbi:hypothetical protein [Yoonia sp.]|uniref:hypothetical protein n=1 Tax=Yoonia sp. TaxID=2212373 RepID=UPI00358FE1EC
MAHALCIIGEAGLNGYKYDSAIGMLTRKMYDSKKGRWMIAKSPTFESTEFRHYLSLAVTNGFVDAGPDNKKVLRGELDGEEWLLELTLAGWNYIEDHDKPVIEGWFGHVKENLPSYVVAVTNALLIAWLTVSLGFSS